ncbi:MAG: hypothetical protein HKN99_04080 [Winogradskyella sp.]|nr:hypothetical protein [Winogradskyella sp.]
MGLELVIFIVAILFGIFLYWRESNSNKAYRFLNKMVNTIELQMTEDNPKGFIYKQTFIPRLIFVVSMVLLVSLVLQFVTPLNIFGSFNGLSVISSIAVGTLIGTYLASFVIKSSEILEEKSDSLGDLVSDTVEKGKDIIEDFTKGEEQHSAPQGKKSNMPEEKETKSARQRLKDKGLM